MLSESSVLFYDEPAYRLGRPIVGGPWLNTRDSAGYEWTGDRHVIRKAHQLRLDNLRWAGAASEGYLIEPAAYQQVADPFKFDAAGWSFQFLTRTDAPSLFEGKVASKLVATGGAGGQVMTTSIGTWTGGPECATWELEMGSAEWLSLGMYDATAGVWANLCYFDVANETLTPYYGNTGTEMFQYFRFLGYGPHGGKVFRFVLSATNTAGRARYAFTYIGTGVAVTAGQSVYAHYVGWEAASWASTPFEGVLLRDDLSAAPIPAEIPWCGCLEMVAGEVIGLDLYKTFLGIRSSGGGGAAPWFFIYTQPSAALIIFRYSDGVTDRQAYVSPGYFGEGAPLTLTWAVNATGYIRAQARIGNGTTAAAISAAGGGFAPWPAGTLLNAGAIDDSGLYAARMWQRRLGIYRSADLTDPTDHQAIHRQCSLFRLDPAGHMLRSG